MKKLTTILMAAVIVMLSSCSKEGPQGPAGTNGTNGTNGNANVTVKKIDYFEPTWTSSFYLGSIANKSTITDDDINTTVMDKGVVLAFTKIFSTEWYNLPFSGGFTGSTQYIHYAIEPGKLNIYAWQKSDAGVLSRFTPNIESLKYIIILDRTVLRLKKPLTQMSYKEVCKMLNIEE